MDATTFFGRRGGPFGSAIPLWNMGRAVREGIAAGGTEAWLRRLVSAYLRWYYARPRRAEAREAETEERAAHAVVQRACVRSALMGGATGAFTTLTSLVTANSNGTLGVIALPAAATVLGAEAVARIAVHLEMICDLVELFDLRFDPEDPTDLWALLALTFDSGDAAPRESPPRAGDRLVHLARVQAEEIARGMGRWIVGDSLVRNAVPVVSIASSSVLSYLVTRRLGDNARRYARYRRAFDDVLSVEGLDAHLDLLIEGVWFIFTADGTLQPEESALLASLVRRASPATYARICDELADDISWVQRLPRIPEHLRDTFLRALEVAAAVDKKATLRERRLLEHAARALGRREDFVGLGRMMRDFRDVGVLSETMGAPPPNPRPE